MSFTRDGLTRRGFLRAGAGGLLAPWLPEAALARQGIASGAGFERTLSLSEGTNFAVAVAPDGSEIAFDLFGILWIVPVAGGDARRLTDDEGDIAQPQWSPDGRTLVFQSYRDGNYHLWSIRRDGGELTQLTRGPFDCREPHVAPDGQRIVFASDRGGSYGIHILDLRSGECVALTDSPDQEYAPVFSPDGRRVAFVKNKTAIDVIEADGTRHTVASIAPSPHPFITRELLAPVWTPDGAELLYSRVDNGAVSLMRGEQPLLANCDLFPFRPGFLSGATSSTNELIYSAAGKIRRRALGEGETKTIEFRVRLPVVEPVYRKKRRDFDSDGPRPVRGIGGPVLSPEGSRIVFRALNDLWLLRIGGVPEPLTRDVFFQCDADFSPDGKQLAFSTDRGGKHDIWIRDFDTGGDRQLTQLANAALSCRWSPDGKEIAFLDQRGALYSVEVASGAVTQWQEPLWEPGRPSWSADGQRIALAAFKPYSARFREGLNEILVIDRHGAANYFAPLPHRSLSTRGDDGPVWSPDGAYMAFVLDSVLWIQPVDALGRPNAAPRQLNHEVSDAPSWSGDSRTLLYLSNGSLRLIDIDGGAPRTVPLRLDWNPARPRQRTVIRAGRLWDGSGAPPRRDLDVLLEDHKIVGIETRREREGLDAHFIDASNQTVMPGLMDMHTHRQMQGYAFGDRQGRLWLSFGITTTRSPGAPAYHMVEDREAIDAGLRIGPRHFATGEAIDGTRIYYNFMRPVHSDEQLALELQRAQALSYDLMKTYVRLPNAQQRRVIEWAHQQGIGTASHYLHPNLAYGGDAMEHMGATSRLGFSRSVSPGGAGYRDVLEAFIQTRAARTPTLFGAQVLLTEDDALLRDERVRVLYPPWEYAKLQQRVRELGALDQSGIRTGLANQVAQVRAILQAGGRILAGTDAPIDFMALSLHLNLRALVRYGLSPEQALLTATRAPGEFLEAPMGVIRPGYLADIIVVDGNPLERIEDTARVQWVVKNGEVFAVRQLLEPFAETRFETAPRHITAACSSHSSQYWWHHADYVQSGACACCAEFFAAVWS